MSVFLRAPRGVRVIALRSVFSPLTLVAFLYLPLLLAYALASPRVFVTEFDSRKTLSWSGFSFFALALALFAAGAWVGRAGPRPRFGRPPRPPTVELPSGAKRRSLAVLLETALVISLAAYAVWFGLGIARAGGPLELLDLWRRNPHVVKGDILATVPGVTTLTQLAVAAVPLALAYGLARRGSVLRALVVVAFALAAVRSVLYSERLALLELFVPALFLAAAPRRIAVPRVVVYALAFVALAAGFFAATELRRTYVYTHDFSVGRSTVRFLGYYLTSINNGMAVVDHYPARTPLYSTGDFLWRFPGLRDLRVEHVPALGTVSFRYADSFGVDPEELWPVAFAQQDLDYEFNVFTAPGFLAADFGWAALLAMLLLGLVSGRLYARSAESTFHRALYAMWLAGLFELMRILYFTSTRVFPAYLVFLGAWLVLRRRERTLPLPEPSGVRAATDPAG